MIECSRCDGKGRYVGLNEVEDPCEECGGDGGVSKDVALFVLQTVTARPYRQFMKKADEIFPVKGLPEPELEDL